MSGRAIQQRRDQYAQLRQELQQKRTRSAKRRMRALNQRENRWMTAVNHRLSKALVDQYGTNTVFVLEDLEEVNWQRSFGSARNNKRHTDWAFYQLETFLGYKAILAGSLVLKVDAQYTSQRCPKCGSIAKENRDHRLHAYQCGSCGYRSNDDRVAAINIQELGKLWVSGETVVRYEKQLPTV